MGRSANISARSLLPQGAKRPAPRRGRCGGESAAVQAIWEVVGMIPRGKVSTYGAVARAAGLPGRARLAGTALKMAPEQMHLPWHRVVGAGGRIVFAKNSAPHREQARRLRAERVPIKSGRVDREFVTDLEGFHD